MAAPKLQGRAQIPPTKGVTGGPSGPSREGSDVGHKIVLDIKQMTKERKKKRVGKGKNV